MCLLRLSSASSDSLKDAEDTSDSEGGCPSIDKETIDMDGGGDLFLVTVMSSDVGAVLMSTNMLGARREVRKFERLEEAEHERHKWCTVGYAHLLSSSFSALDIPFRGLSARGKRGSSKKAENIVNS